MQKGGSSAQVRLPASSSWLPAFSFELLAKPHLPVLIRTGNKCFGVASSLKHEPSRGRLLLSILESAYEANLKLNFQEIRHDDGHNGGPGSLVAESFSGKNARGRP